MVTILELVLGLLGSTPVSACDPGKAFGKLHCFLSAFVLALLTCGMLFPNRSKGFVRIKTFCNYEVLVTMVMRVM